MLRHNQSVTHDSLSSIKPDSDNLKTCESDHPDSVTMNVHTILLFFTLTPLVFSQINPRCCQIGQSVIRKNETYECQADTLRRIQTKFVKNDFVSIKQAGKCTDVLNRNTTGIFEVDQSGTITKGEVVKVDFYPKCCPLGRTYDRKLHSCKISPASSELENSIPKNTFISVGLPLCQIISDLAVWNLGDLRISEGRLTLKQGERSLEQGEFCVDATMQGSFVVRRCEKYEICEKIRCIRKCCPDGQSFVNGSKCVDTFSYGVDLKASKNIEEPEASFAIIHGMSRPIYILKGNRNFEIDKTGIFSIYSNITQSYLNYKPSDETYCIEHAKKGRLDTYAIFSKVLKPPLEIKFAFTRWFKIVSCICLFLTMAVYLSLPKMLNLFGKILLSYSFATFLFFLSLCIAQFVEFEDTVCKIMGFLMIVTTYWSFTWLNIMCIDIWISFGNPRTLSGPLQRNELKKLIQYSIYGWTIPFIWILIILLFNTTRVLPDSVHPYIGTKKCYMENTSDHPGNYAYNIFITLPVLLQQIANIVLFVKTLIYCLKIKADIQKMNESSKKTYRVGKEELNLVMKLAVIMGVSFIFETVSSIFDFNNGSITRVIEVVGDSINCSQGVFIFVVFICKKKIYDGLMERWYLRKPCKYDVSSSLGTQESFHTNTINRETITLR